MMNQHGNKVIGLFKKQKYCDNPESYAYALSIYKIIWLFVIGSIAGYLIETGWYYLIRGHFVNRQGLVIGPFSPIYGVGTVLITSVLYKIRNVNALYIAIISGICGGMFEYFCSVLQEEVLGTRSWDYSMMPFNIDGRTSLKFMIFWGILGMIFIRNTYPFFSRYIERLSDKTGKILAIAVLAFMVFDCLFSFGATLRQKDRRYGIPAVTSIDKFYDSYYTDEKLAQIYTEVSVVNTNGKVNFMNYNK